jgi:UPF0271 protein
MTIDLNCDMGEGIDNDEAIMPYITSANIACGYHAGDEKTMNDTVALALKYEVAIGAHPGFNDKENFGRTEMHLSMNEIYLLVQEQLQILNSICIQHEAKLHHVKPHGALYNMAARNQEMSRAIAKSVYDFDASLVLYGLAGSYMISEAHDVGLKTCAEVFADRTYMDDGSLTPRSQIGCIIIDEITSIQQVLQMIKQNTVTSINGKTVPVTPGTICIHGDGANAVAFARNIHQQLQQHEIGIQPKQ